jgi:polyhydroxyalkanoate synthase
VAELFDLKNIQSFLRGVNRFYTHFERRNAANQIIWQEGSTSIIDHSQFMNNDLPILFLIPSLINKSYIFDLIKDMSMVRYFASLGYRVYLVDFAEPLKEEYNMGFSDYSQRLNRAINAVCKDSPVVTIGYCLGGVFSCAIHSSSKANLLGQVLIATPWDFSHFKKILGLSDPLILKSFLSIVSAFDKVSPSLVQWFFSSIDPNKIWNKFAQFSEMELKQDVDKFVSVEQWINDGISISKKFAHESLSMLHSNDLARGKYFVLNSISPSLVIAGLEDKIVPPSSYLGLGNLLKNKVLIEKRAGHIGLIIGSLAKKEIWPEISDWLKQRA